jgi:hypothetical protein
MSGASLCGTRPVVVVLLLQLRPSSASSSLEKDIQDFLSFNTRVNSRCIGDDDDDDVSNYIQNTRTMDHHFQLQMMFLLLLLLHRALLLMGQHLVRNIVGVITQTLATVIKFAFLVVQFIGSR